MIKIIGSVLLAIWLAFQAGGGLEKYKSEARGLVKEFASSLKKELIKGFKSGGAVNAIGVCNIKAPEIAKSISGINGWQIGRTSLKTRNENNSPDDWELKVLYKFEKMKAEGAKTQELEYAEIIKSDTVSIFRYMKAIPTGGLCLQCHGDKLQSEVEQKIKELYPKDKATGFHKGDLRGAFTLKKIID